MRRCRAGRCRWNWRRKCCATSSITTTEPSPIEQIQKFVADYYQLKLTELKSRNNSKSIAMPRQVAMYLCKSLTHASLPEIGRSFGGKHHSTVIHSIKKVEDLRKKDTAFNTLMHNLLESSSEDRSPSGVAGFSTVSTALAVEVLWTNVEGENRWPNRAVATTPYPQKNSHVNY